MAGLSSVILVVHILVAIAMVGVIMLQRSEGGALGLGGGSNSFLSARSAGNVLTRTTTILVVVFFLTSMLLTVLSQHAGPKTLDLTTPASGAAAPVAIAPGTAKAPASGADTLPALPGFPGSTTTPANGTPSAPVAAPSAVPGAPGAASTSQAPVSGSASAPSNAPTGTAAPPPSGPAPATP